MNNATMKYAKSKYHNNKRCSQEFYQNQPGREWHVIARARTHTRPTENVTDNRSHLSLQNMKITCGGYTPAKNICSQILLFVS